MSQKLITLGNLTEYDVKIKEYLATEDAKSLHKVIFDSTNKQIKFYKDPAATVSDTADFSVDIPADLDGSATIASVSNGVVTLKAGISEVDGIVANNSDSDITLAKVATTGAAEDVSIADAGGLITAETVEGALQELAAASAGGVASKTVYLQDESAGQSAYAKVYKLYQGSDSSDMTQNTLVGTINIPLDKVLQDASIVTITYDDGKLYDGVTDVTALIVGSGTATAADAGKYMKFEFQNVTDPVYVNLSEFIDIYTTEQNASQIQLTIDGSNVISGEIVDGSVDTDALGTSAVTTAKIADGNVTTAKIADSNVTTAKIADSNVTTAKIADSNVTTAKIADDAVTADKISVAAHTESVTAGADGIAVSVTTTDGQVSAVTASIAAGTYEPYGTTSSAISALDATESQTAGTDGLALSITEVDGVITSISGSIAAGTYLDTTNYVMAQNSEIDALFD